MLGTGPAATLSLKAPSRAVPGLSWGGHKLLIAPLFSGIMFGFTAFAAWRLGVKTGRARGNVKIRLNKERAMARVCQITGKAPMVGHNVSHANNKTKRRFLPNLQRRRFFIEGENRWISLRLTTNALRTIDKKGIDVVLAELRAKGEKI